MVEGDFPNLDVVFFEIYDGQVISHGQWTIVGLPNTPVYLQLDIAVIPVVVSNRQARLYHGHQLAETLRWPVDLRGHPIGLFVGDTGCP